MSKILVHEDILGVNCILTIVVGNEEDADYVQEVLEHGLEDEKVELLFKTEAHSTEQNEGWRLSTSFKHSDQGDESLDSVREEAVRLLSQSPEIQYVPLPK